jgi:hypothetical protein
LNLLASDDEAVARTVGDIPNRYTSDVVLNQQARVALGAGMADCLPGGPVAGKPMAVQYAGACGGSRDELMADPETSPWRVALEYTTLYRT